MKMYGASLGGLIGLLAATLALADSPRQPVLDPGQPSRARKGAAATYDVDYAITVTAPYRTKLLRVWLPLPPSDEGQKVESKELTTFPQEVKPRIGTEPVYGNRFACFDFIRPEGAQIIRHRFRVTVWEQNWDVDPNRVQAVRHWPDRFAPYLGSDASVTVDDAVRKVLGKIVPRPRGPGLDLPDVLDWVNENLKYDHTKASLRASAAHALEHRAGHCSDYHGLCAAFGRALGYPTRICYGMHTFTKSSPSHCKLEAFLPPYGWVSFDVSETQKLVVSIRKANTLSAREKETLERVALRRLHRGFRDNTWFAQTRGTDYALVPPASRRVHVVRTIHAEADGVPLPEPDPADAKKREFAWMTAVRFTPDGAASYPFRDWKALKGR